MDYIVSSRGWIFRNNASSARLCPDGAWSPRNPKGSSAPEVHDDLLRIRRSRFRTLLEVCGFSFWSVLWCCESRVISSGDPTSVAPENSPSPLYRAVLQGKMRLFVASSLLLASAFVAASPLALEKSILSRDGKTDPANTFRAYYGGALD